MSDITYRWCKRVTAVQKKFELLDSSEISKNNHDDFENLYFLCTASCKNHKAVL